jgi:hypothetical protein
MATIEGRNQRFVSLLCRWPLYRIDDDEDDDEEDDDEEKETFQRRGM